MSNKKNKKTNKNKNMSNKKTTIKERNDHLTNLFMIQFSYGVLGIIILTFFNSLYKNPNTLAHMQTTTWILFGVFAVAACGMIIGGIAKKHNRIRNYGILAAACALVSLWLALYNMIRPLLQGIARIITGNQMLNVSSLWNTKLAIYAIVIYLVIDFIVYCVKTSKK